jgi:hypothetical protein
MTGVGIAFRPTPACREEKSPLGEAGSFLHGADEYGLASRSKLVRDPAKHIANLWAQECQDGDNHNGDKHQDQRILSQPLPILALQEQHSTNPPE